MLAIQPIIEGYLANQTSALGKPLGYISQETFPLPNLHTVLRNISQEIHFGHGFKVVRGLPVEKHTREDNYILYAGLSSHIAPLRGRQDSYYDGKPADVVLAHIKNLTSGREKDVCISQFPSLMFYTS